jgi:hypothetical protein
MSMAFESWAGRLDWKQDDDEPVIEMTNYSVEHWRSSSDNRGVQVAARVVGKTPRGQD